MIKTRPANKSDALFVAWVMQEAARSHLPIGMWDLVFPGPDDQRLEKLGILTTTETVHFGHYSRFLIAEENGVPAAALSAYENTRHGPKYLGAALAEAFKTMGLPETELMKVPERMAPMTAIKYKINDGQWVVEWVATKPEFRGRGIIYGLLQEILDKGRKEGFTESQIGYILGNIPAKNAYEKIGYRYVTAYRHPDFQATFGEPGLASMHLSLKSG